MSAMEPEHYVIKSSINRPVVVNYKPLDQSRILTSCMTAQAGLEWIDAWTERRERRKLILKTAFMAALVVWFSWAVLP